MSSTALLLTILTFINILLCIRASSESLGCSSPEMRRFRNSCFWLDNDVLSHALAQTKCKRRGGHLAMPVDYPTQQFIKDLAHGGRYNSYWVGIREVEDSKWIFSDHSPLRDFVYWAPHEPSGAPDEDCVLLASHFQTKWVTTQCHWGYRFICQSAIACNTNDLKAFNVKLNDWKLERMEYHSVGTRVNVECVDGFSRLTGPNYIHCEIGGVWTNSTRCYKHRGCPQPILMPNVRHLRAQNIYENGHTLQLECDRGKMLKGNLTCSENGVWMGETPTCIPITTHRPPSTTTTTRRPFLITRTSPATTQRSLLPDQRKITCPEHGQEKREVPKIVKDVELLTVKTNESVYLPCVSDVRKWPFGLWMKEQNVIDREPHGNSHGARVLSNGTLFIPRMSSATEGLYTCIAFSSKTTDKVNYHSVRLVLPKKCHLRFDTAPSMHVLSTTDFVLLRCHVLDGETSWIKNGQTIATDYNHILLPNSALLVRRSLQTMGEYICRAEHSETHCRLEQSVLIPVEGPIDDICGRARVSSNSSEEVHALSQGKLVGGHVAPKGSHPWIVIFVNLLDEREKFLCGGNLLNHHWIATAAHCFFWVKSDEDLLTLRAKLGKYDRTESEEHEKVVSIERIIRHPDFDTNLKSFDNDIALVRMSESVPFSDSIVPICLPPDNFLARFLPVRYSHSSGTVSGWGRLEEEGLQPRFLHQVRLPLVESHKCFGSTNQKVTENMFCAGYEEAVGDSCQGDSGGPFEMYKDNVAYLAGIVSWGEGCARPGTFGFYTKVENYVPFIKELITSNTVKY